jgi:hypothetical protein
VDRLFAVAATFDNVLMEAGWQLLVHALDGRAPAVAARGSPSRATSRDRMTRRPWKASRPEPADNRP